MLAELWLILMASWPTSWLDNWWSVSIVRLFCSWLIIQKCALIFISHSLYLSPNCWINNSPSCACTSCAGVNWQKSFFLGAHSFSSLVINVLFLVCKGRRLAIVDCWTLNSSLNWTAGATSIVCTVFFSGHFFWAWDHDALDDHQYHHHHHHWMC